MSHRKRNDDGYILPKHGASARTIKRWDIRHEYVKPQADGFKKLGDRAEGSGKDKVSGSFKPMKKVSL